MKIASAITHASAPQLQNQIPISSDVGMCKLTNTPVSRPVCATRRDAQGPHEDRTCATPKSSIGALIADERPLLPAQRSHPALHPKRILTAKYHRGNIAT